MTRRPASGLPGARSSSSLPLVDEDKTKGRTWNGYVCPGCRTVFRVAADFIGADVMCPSCQETLRLPKTPEEVPPHTVGPEKTTTQASASIPSKRAKLAKPIRPADRPQNTAPSVRRAMPSATNRRLKLTLALLLPLTVIAGVLLLFPPKESTPDKAVLENAPPVHPETTPPEKPTPLPPPIAVSEMPVPAPPALPEPEETPVTEFALVQPVPEPVALSTEPVTEPVTAVETLETGLVEAIPATPEPAPAQPAAPAAARPEPETAAAPAKLVHTVVRGDTLTKLSRRYRVTPQQIMQANGMKNDVVRLGRKLVIPAAP